MCVTPFGAKVEAVMREAAATSGSRLGSVDPEARIPVHDPLRKIREVVTAALASLDTGSDALRSDFGRPSAPPERLT